MRQPITTVIVNVFGYLRAKGLESKIKVIEGAIVEEEVSDTTMLQVDLTPSDPALDVENLPETLAAFESELQIANAASSEPVAAKVIPPKTSAKPAAKKRPTKAERLLADHKESVRLEKLKQAESDRKVAEDKARRDADQVGLDKLLAKAGIVKALGEAKALRIRTANDAATTLIEANADAAKKTAEAEAIMLEAKTLADEAAVETEALRLANEQDALELARENDKLKAERRVTAKARWLERRTAFKATCKKGWGSFSKPRAAVWSFTKDKAAPKTWVGVKAFFAFLGTFGGKAFKGASRAPGAMYQKRKEHVRDKTRRELITYKPSASLERKPNSDRYQRSSL